MGLMFTDMSLIVFFIMFATLWTCHDASDTLKPGDILNSSSPLVSASEKFTLAFNDHYTEGYDYFSYLTILTSEIAYSEVWIGNRRNPIPPGLSSPILTLDRNNTLKVMYEGGDPLVLFSAPQTKNGTVEATILDSGNFVLKEINSKDRSTKQVLWQSFDYPADTFLPGMKLGVNHKTGHIWSLSSWATDSNPAPGHFTLDWDHNEHQLKISRDGVVYWTSGVFRPDGRFEFILPDESNLRYNFSIVSNEIEDYLTYAALEDQSDDSVPELVLLSNGTLHDNGGQVDIAQAGNCDGYNTSGGCRRRNRSSIDCMTKFGDEFESKNGNFKPSDNISNATSRTPYFWFGLNKTSSDCKASCWKNCDCLGFDFPVVDTHTNTIGCKFWSADSQFVEGLVGSATPISSYVLARKLTRQTKSQAPKNIAKKKWRWIGIAIAIGVILIIVICIVCYLQRRRKFAPSVSGCQNGKIQEYFLNLVKRIRPANQNDGKMGHHDLSAFSYASVVAATSNFSVENKLGEGGFGPVYKGKLSTGREVAVKKLSKCSGQGVLEFKNELILIHELQHTNLVQLFGFCIHGEERMLIYEYMPNKSLDFFLFDSTRSLLLDWKKRFAIIEGITQGMLYLHKYSRTRVIHRDLKASNILLDQDMNPKISDFGMARIFTHELETNTIKIVGTRGYMAPEYVLRGNFSTKSDVYSFGVLLLEIISGRKNNSFQDDENVLNLVGYAWELWKRGEGLQLKDPTLLVMDSCVSDQLLRCVHVGLLCAEEDASDRPTMSDVLPMLTNQSLPLPRPTKPAFCIERSVVMAAMIPTPNGAGTRPQNMSINGMSNTDLGGR